MTNAAVQKEALPLAGLLSNVMVQTLAKLSMLNLSKPDIDSGRMMTNGDAANLTKPDIGKCVTDSIRARLGRGSEGFIAVTTRGRKGFSGLTTRGAGEFKDTLGGSFETNTRAEFSDSIKKGSHVDATLWSCTSAYHSSGASTFALRRSALSFLPQASSTHEEKLALGLSVFSLSTLDSIPATSSCGKRIAFLSDLLFLFPVAISNTHVQLLSGNTPYIKGSANKTVDVVAHQNVWWSHTLPTGKAQVIPKITTPRSGGTLPRRLTKPLIEVTVMAGSQHTQTHPKFTWRFLALNASSSAVIHIIATTEREARDQSPDGCVMVFAGRLPVEGVNYVA